jgi:hypothetical protein
MHLDNQPVLVFKGQAVYPASQIIEDKSTWEAVRARRFLFISEGEEGGEVIVDVAAVVVSAAVVVEVAAVVEVTMVVLASDPTILKISSLT